MNTSIIIVVSVAVIIVSYIYFSIIRFNKMPVVDNSPGIIELDDSNFKTHIKSGIIVVDFWAEWCMPCKMMTSVLNAVADETLGKATICKVNIDYAKRTAATFKVRSIPTLIIFKNGAEGQRIVGVKTKEFIIGQINQLNSKN